MHRLERQLRGVAIPTEMSEHNAIDFSGQQFLDHACCRCVREMTMPRLDSLFHWPRPMCVVLQQFLIVICLNYECLHPTQSFNDHLGRVTQIGDEPETT